MNIRAKASWVVLLALLVLLAGWLWHIRNARGAEPTFEGRRARYWLAYLSIPVQRQWNQPNLFPVSEAEEHPSYGAFRCMGADGVCFLLKALESKEPEVALNAATLLGATAPLEPRVAKILASASFSREPTYHKVYRRFYGLLPGALAQHLAKPAIPDNLANYFLATRCFQPGRGDPWTRKAAPARMAWVRFTQRARETDRANPGSVDGFVEVVPILTRALRERNELASFHAAEGLLQLGPLARSASPALLKQFRDPTRNVFLRATYIRALLEIGYETSDGSSIFLSAFAETNRFVKCAAIAGMRLCPPASVTNCLLKAVSSDDALLQHTAYNCLSGIDSASLRTIYLPPQIIRNPASPATAAPWDRDDFWYNYFPPTK